MWLWFAIFLVVFFAIGQLLAQSNRARITGSAKDVSAAVASGAQVTATNLSTNLQSIAATNKVGVYTLLNLPIGEYSLACSKQGLANYSRRTLAIDQAAHVIFVLKIGARSEAATVTANASPLQPQTSSGFILGYVAGLEGVSANPADKDFGSHINGSLSDTKEVMIEGTSAVLQIGGYLSECLQPPWFRGLKHALEDGFWQGTSAGPKRITGTMSRPIWGTLQLPGTNCS